DMTVDVSAGTVLSVLWRAVEERGLFYPPDPNSFDLCTIGGNIACNAGGPRALKYGVTRNYVLGLEVVLPGGQVLQVGKRTLKHVTGYDLAGLIVGSEGTLGVITKATLRLLPKPAAVETGLVTFSHVGEAARALTLLLAEGHSPRVLELLDHHALDAVRRSSPGVFPEDAGALIIIETDGHSQARAFEDLERLAARCLEEGALDVQVAHNEADRRRIWKPRNTLSESLRTTAEAKISEDIVVPRSRIPDFIATAGALSERHGVRVATYGHAGDGNLHVNVLFDEANRQAAEAAVVDVMKEAVAFGGTLSGEHGLGLTKRAFLPFEHPPEKIAVQRALKATLDPLDILNPGKIFPEEVRTSP
ncbi:MAG: FAD-linked oxidase C-terminal domain-containing protein, partial [Myxococcota bacterium]